MSTRTASRPFSAVALAQTALFAALIAVCSWITVPMVVPFTLQTFAVFLALLMLGGRRGTAAVTVYLLLGLVGAPVFSGFRGGVGVLFGATGGYLLGFLLTALLYWLVTALCGDRPLVRVLTLVAGNLLCYAFGTAWFVVVYAGTAAPVSVMTALAKCVFPFLIPDAAKLALAVLMASQLKKRLRF